MKHDVIDGVVVRVRDMGDRDRYLSVLTAEKGRISLLSKGLSRVFYNTTVQRYQFFRVQSSLWSNSHI